MLVYTQREPLGVVTVISPWNFPVSIPARKIAPALITGNTVVFKPSSDAPLSGYRLAQALIRSGLPKGVLNFITGSAAQIGSVITESPHVRAISFTGSTDAGKHIHNSVPMTTRVQMELGGKNPLIVMEDADLDLAVDLAIKGGLSLSGQACTGTSRILVVQAGARSPSSKSWSPASRHSRSAVAPRPAWTWGRWRPPSSSRPCCRTWPSASRRPGT